MAEVAFNDSLDPCLNGFAEGNAACPLSSRLTDYQYAIDVFRWDNVVFMVLALIVLVASKYLYWLQLAVNWKFSKKRPVDAPLGVGNAKDLVGVKADDVELGAMGDGDNDDQGGDIPLDPDAVVGEMSVAEALHVMEEYRLAKGSESGVVSQELRADYKAARRVLNPEKYRKRDVERSMQKFGLVSGGGGSEAGSGNRGTGIFTDLTSLASGVGGGGAATTDDGGAGTSDTSGLVRRQTGGGVSSVPGDEAVGVSAAVPTGPGGSHHGSAYRPVMPRTGCLGIDLEDLLVEKDNKAVAIVFAAYMFAIGLVLRSAMSELTYDQVDDTVDVVIWSVVGTVMLMISGWLNQALMLSRLVTYTTLVTHQNFAVAVVSASAYIASGIMVAAAVSGVTIDRRDDLLSALLYFIISQLVFVAFSLLYSKAKGYDVARLVEAGNAASAVSYGADLIVIAMLAANAVTKSEELLSFLLWFFVAGAFLLLLRLLAGYIMLPGVSLNEEIERDHNWGAALLLGSMEVAAVLALNTLLPDVCAEVSFVFAAANQ